MDVATKRYLQRLADALAAKTGDDAWGTVDLEGLYGWGADPERSIEDNADYLLDHSVEPHHVGQREAEKSAAQLDADIAEVLTAPKRKRVARKPKPRS